MSREWSDDGDGEYPFELWERSLENSMNSKRGQKFLRDLFVELEAMRERGEGRLLSGYLLADGKGLTPWNEPIPAGCCTLGVMYRKCTEASEMERWINREMEDPYDFPSQLPKALGIAKCLVAEIGSQNDNSPEVFTNYYGTKVEETEEQRFNRMLEWVRKHISVNGERVCR